MSDSLNMEADAASGSCCAPGEECAPEGGVSHASVQAYYGAAAQAPRAELCCPTSYDASHVDHIPEEVLAISYGCGSPMGQAAPRKGDTVLDLGSGGGIDCFIAARMVGSSGRVIGIDMTDEMLARARGSARQVSANLGYDVVSFQKGLLEAVPVGDGEVDLVTSNCVLNLSPDKPKVFGEIFRILAHGGRFVISDIVAGVPVPQEMRDDTELWGECISGALTERAFVQAAEEAGFTGITLTREYLWKQVNGIDFYSTTFRAWKYEKSADCAYVGQTAVYLGPGREFTDDEGHTFRRGEIVEICTDTAEKLAAEPYKGMFEVSGAEKKAAAGGCC